MERAIEGVIKQVIEPSEQYTRIHAKLQFSKYIHKPTISDAHTALKYADFSVPILKMSPAQDLEPEL